jgi:SMODS and SLOG-associating 2TM effector domain family 5
MTNLSLDDRGPRMVRPSGAHYAQHPLKWKLVNDYVKRARFNAAKRLERKNAAGLVTLAIVALYGGLISVFNLMFKHRVGADTRDVLEYVAVVSSWATLIIGLTEQLKGYGDASRELHACAREVNDLQRRLAVTSIADEAQLGPFLAAYRDIIARCRPNHDDVDYRLAEATPSLGERQFLEAEGKWDAVAFARRERWARLGYHVATYWFYVAIWFAPALVGLALWLLVPASPVTPAA